MKSLNQSVPPSRTGRSEPDAWEMLHQLPGWVRDRVVSVDYFQAASQAYNLAEVVLSEALPQPLRSGDFRLLLLLPRGEVVAREADLGLQRFRRGDQAGNLSGNLYFGAAADCLHRSGGPYCAIMLTIAESAWRMRLQRLSGQDSATLDLLQGAPFRDDVVEVCLKWLLEIHRHAAGGAERGSVDEILDRILLRLSTVAKNRQRQVTAHDPRRPESLRRTIEYMHAYCERQLPREQLATIAGVSPCYFTRLFAKTVGETPKRYLLRLRVEKAKRMLRENADISLAEVSAASGFWNASHLCREFNRFVGVSAQVYRRYS